MRPLVLATLLAGLSLPAAALLPPRAAAQTLKLATLRVFPSDVVGPWVTYRVRTRSGRTGIREFTQRVAIVSREVVKGKRGFWVELKTTGRSGTRIERGLFAIGPAPVADDPEVEIPDKLRDDMPPEDSSGDGIIVEEPSAAPDSQETTPLTLVRYQVLTPGGKLYEYPVASATSPRAGGEVSTYELFEFDPSVRPIRTFLGPDTLRMGRRVVPAVLERSVRVGTDDWPTMDDGGAAHRLVLTQMLWRNAAVPITGFARSLFRVTTRRVTAGQDSAAAFVPIPDSLLAFTPADTTTGPTNLTPGDERPLAWTELTLLDLGADAVAEVTQKPEPAPVSELRGPPGPLR